MISRALTTIGALVLCIGCATSGRVGPTQYYDAIEEGTLWGAALQALQVMGADVKISSRASGVISATMNVVEMGGGVQLDINVDRQLQGAEVQVRANLIGASEPSVDQVEDLKLLEREFLDLVDQAVRQLMGGGRGVSIR